GWFASARVISLPLDKLNKTAVHIERRDHQFLQAGIASETGKGVKHSRHFLGQLRLAREQAEVRINACGAWMVIACPEMDIVPESICIAPDNEHRFAVRLQTDHTVNDVGAGFFEPPRPLNIRRFIKPRAKLDD